MLIHDIVAHSRRDLEACRTLAPVGDYVVVESDSPGGWFALHYPTMRSIRIEDLDPDTRRIAERRIENDDAIDVLSIDELLIGSQPLTEAFMEPTGLLDAFQQEPLDEGIYDKHILKAIFVAGSGGAGKSQVIDTAFAGEGLKVISQDKHLERFLKAANIPLSQAGEHYGLFRKARDLRGKELRHYANRRLGLVIDSTGWAYDRIAKPAKRLRDLGYDVSMIFVDVSLDTALRRNKKRAKAGGRDVPKSFIRDAQQGAARNMKRYMKLFGQRNFFYVDNDKDLPPAKWDREVGREVRKYARAILRRKIRNPKGRKWLKKQANPKTADYNNPDAPLDWPKPEEPKPYKTKLKKSKVSSKYPPLTKDQKKQRAKAKKLVKKFTSEPEPKRTKLPKVKKSKSPKPEKTKKFGKQADGSFVWPGIGESVLFPETEADPFDVLTEAVKGVVDMIKSQNWQVVDLGDAGWFRVYSAMPVKSGKAFSHAHSLADYHKKVKTGELMKDPQIEAANPKKFAEETSKALRALGVPKQRSVVVFGGHDHVDQKSKFAPSGMAIRAKHIIHLKRGKRSPVSLAHEWAHHLWWRLPKKSRDWFKQWYKRAVIRELAVEIGKLKKGQYDSNLIHNMRQLLKTGKGKKLRDLAKKKGLVPSSYAAGEYAELFAEAVAYAAIKPNRVSIPLRKAIFNVLSGATRDEDLPPKVEK